MVWPAAPEPEALQVCVAAGRVSGGLLSLLHAVVHTAKWLRWERMAREQLAWWVVGTWAQIIASFKYLEPCLWGERDQAVLPPEQGLLVDSSSPPGAHSSQVSSSGMAGDWSGVCKPLLLCHVCPQRPAGLATSWWPGQQGHSLGTLNPDLHWSCCVHLESVTT